MTSHLIWALTATAITAMICTSALSAWRGWLELRRRELDTRRGGDRLDRAPARLIELGDVRERLRKLEAIARGVDL
jgi:hypothetical protein